jgi:hypothetical protein
MAARVEIGDVVIDGIGRPVSGASVQVNRRSGGAATVYSGPDGDPVGNPITTDTFGRIEGWVAEGSYDLVASGFRPSRD